VLKSKELNRRIVVSNDCLFCKIISGAIPAEKVYEKNNVIGFKDINPLAPIHLLFIHKNHTKDLNDFCANDPNGLMELISAIAKYSEEKGLKQSGYRVVSNIGTSSGQSVFHTHFHVLSGPRLGKFGT
jgi:histidine triad (HIT) family protein